jgi:hypothetical protein
MIDFETTIAANIETSLNKTQHPSLPKGSSLYGATKVFQMAVGLRGRLGPRRLVGAITY